MIDIENAVFARAAERLRQEFPGIWVSSVETSKPSDFPAVSIVETDNSVYQKMRTTRIENAAKLLYEVSVYSNLEGYAKQEAQDIMQVVDGVFSGLNFTRTMCSPVSNLMDSKIYRLLARYEAVVDTEHFLYTH